MAIAFYAACPDWLPQYLAEELDQDVGELGKANTTPTMDRKAELRAVLPAIRRLLMSDWDPIGVANEPAARGEYDQDALALYGMLANGASDTEIEAYLAKTELEIGLGGGSQRPHREIVQSLRKFGVEQSSAVRAMASTQALPAEIRTARLVLRRQHPDDARMINDAVNTSLAHLQSSVAWAQAAPMSLATLTSRLAASAAAFDAGEAWAFTVLDLAESRVLGGVALERAEEALVALVGQDALEAGYWLRADATGHGYATEATACVTELAFTRLGALRVVICHDPSNAASEGVPRRLGFRCIGTVADALLPGRQAADGSVRPATKVWVLEASARNFPSAFNSDDRSAAANSGEENIR